MAGFVLFLCLMIIFLPSCRSLPMCIDSTYPRKLNTTLSFCGYSNRTCCTAADDLAIKDQFSRMNISDAACADVVKSIICAHCNPYAFELYKRFQKYPVLCNNTDVTPALPNNNKTGFCALTWETCKDVAMSNSPFSNSNAMPTKLAETYKSANDFCANTGSTATDETICFNGGTLVGFNGTQLTPAPQGMCLERLFNKSYNNIQPHPDGSNRVFLATQSGKIFLATVPPQGSKKTLEIDLMNPFIDLTDAVHYDNEFGLTGFAFHPNFGANGRFFVAYNCDKAKSAMCFGKCSCNSEIKCDPSKLGSDKGSVPCQYQAVVAEFTVNDTSTAPNAAKVANPAEVRRILTMGLPYTTHHGGQIFFGPSDGYLYFMMGDGGNVGDPWNFAQNKKALLGKSLRLDVDVMPKTVKIGCYTDLEVLRRFSTVGSRKAGSTFPFRKVADLDPYIVYVSGYKYIPIDLAMQETTEAESDNLTLWGSYSIPRDNPYYTDKGFRPEVYSYGHRNPWRCTFDSDRPNYLFCGETSQDTYEEINLIVKGGNYGWRIYQGNNLYNPPWAPGPNISADSIDPIFPVLGYNRSEANNNLGSAAIVAGYVYRTKTDPCLYGRYIYADLYANDLWVAEETPRGSGSFRRDKINFTCSTTSPIPCDYTGKSMIPSLGYILSFGQDNNRDMFFVTTKGVYRVVRPSLCGYTCNAETVNPPPPASPSVAGVKMENPILVVLVCLVIFLGLRV